MIDDEELWLYVFQYIVAMFNGGSSVVVSD